VVDPTVDGPRTVANNIDSSPNIATQITQQAGGGNAVRFGDLQLVPVADGLVWVRPFYVQVRPTGDRSASVTEYRFVIVYHQGDVGYGDSLSEALAQVFPGYEGDLGDRVGADTGTEETPPPETADGTPAELLAQADQLLDEADQALRAGDLGTYQDKVDQSRALIQQALSGLNGAS
jgi:uncharacterized membrane protein (UPF0182 family)